MFAAVLRDAWRQYRRRPLAAVITVVVGGLPVFLEPDDPVVAVPLAVFLLGAGLLVELFLVAWLAGALDPAPPPGRGRPGHHARHHRPRGPGRAAARLLPAAGPDGRAAAVRLARGAGRCPSPSRPSWPVGLWPLFGIAFAFLAVLMQRVVLGGERRVRQAASVSHRVASAHFPICLLIGLLQASGLVLASLVVEFWVLAALSILLALADPYLIGMSNALYLRTRADQEPVDAGDGSLRPPRR